MCSCAFCLCILVHLSVSVVQVLEMEPTDWNAKNIRDSTIEKLFGGGWQLHN